MNSIAKLSPALRSGLTEEPEVLIGTPDEEVSLSLASNSRVLTGQAAQRSVNDRYARARQQGEEALKDVSLPVNTRAQRRAQARHEAKQQRRGQWAYTRRELARERVTADLAYRISLADKTEPARPWVRYRSVGHLANLAAQLVAQDQERYDEEFAAWDHKNKDEAPARPLRHDEAEQRVRDLAKQAPPVVRPKVKDAPMNLDEIAEVLEELGAQPNAELVFRYNGLTLDVRAITVGTTHGAEPGTALLTLEED